MPELLKKSDRRAREKWKKRYFFCHPGRTGCRSIFWNFIKAGWTVINDDPVHPTREEIFKIYKNKRGTDRIMPEESLAIVRHPVARLHSHLRWAISNNKYPKDQSRYFEFLENSIENMYENDLGRQIIPCFDSILFDATVIQYEIGHRRIADFLVENNIIETWSKNIKIREEASVKIDWSKCPESFRDKILKTYEKDFEQFDYDPFEFLKK